MKLGRNDRCPCGSGKKYKHCCLNSEAVPAATPADLTWRRLRRLLDGFANEMLRFTAQAYGSSALHEAWDEFTGLDTLEFDSNTPLMQLFMPWFFHCWAPDPVTTEVVNKSLHGVIPTKAYLATKGRRLDPLLRRYLESLLTAPFTFFEVLACDPGTAMTLRDVMTQEEHAVTERGASQGMQPGDMLFGQLASVDQLTMIEAFNGFAIPPMEKASIVELRTRIASVHQLITHQVLRDWNFELLDLFHEIADHLFNPRLPTLQNTDGEPLSPHKLVFDLKALPQAAFDALKHLALDGADEELLADATRDSEDKLTGVRFSWKKRGNKKHVGWDNTVLGWIEIDGVRVIAEVNSKARADAIRKKIETALGAGIRYRATEIQSLERMLADQRAAGNARGDAASEESERLAALPEVREKISEMMAAHWEHWVSQPLPILGNRTPMDAVKDPDGREIVESLVLQGERLGRGPNLQTDEAVFRRLRGRLGLAGRSMATEPQPSYEFRRAK
jgi:SEC-C motif-containing protein